MRLISGIQLQNVANVFSESTRVGITSLHSMQYQAKIMTFFYALSVYSLEQMQNLIMINCAGFVCCQV